MKINDPAVKMIFESIVLDPSSILACTRLAAGVDCQDFQKIPFTMGICAKTQIILTTNQRYSVHLYWQHPSPLGSTELKIYVGTF